MCSLKQLNQYYRMLINQNKILYHANGAWTSGPFLANAKTSRPVWRFPRKPNIPITEAIVGGNNDTIKLKVPYPRLTAVINRTTSLAIMFDTLEKHPKIGIGTFASDESNVNVKILYILCWTNWSGKRFIKNNWIDYTTE